MVAHASHLQFILCVSMCAAVVSVSVRVCTHTMVLCQKCVAYRDRAFFSGDAFCVWKSFQNNERLILVSAILDISMSNLYLYAALLSQRVCVI